MKHMDEWLFATDEECAQMRAGLIACGRIVPAGNANAASSEIAYVPEKRRVNVNTIPDEGTYKVRKIGSDAEYERRRRNYLIMLQSVLRTRRELGLEFGRGEDSEE